MGLRYIGNSPDNRDSQTTNGYTFLSVITPAPIRGMMKKWDIYVQTSGTFKVKLFYDDGTNFAYKGESSLTASLSTGLNSDLGCWLPVEEGYLIGIYSAAGKIDSGEQASGGYYKSGDVTTTTAKNTWTGTNAIHSLRGKIFSRAGIM